MTVKTIKTNTTTWHYLTDFGQEEMEFLKKNYKFHPLDLKDCAGEIQRSKMDTYKNYIFFIFQLPVLDRQNNKVSINQVYFFLGKNYLITISKERNKSLNSYFYKLVNNQKFKDELLARDASYLFYKILDFTLRNSWQVHGHIDQEIRRVEKDIDDGRGRKAVFQIAALRRVILQLKAIVDPQKLVTNTLSRVVNNVEFLNKDMVNYFDDLDDFTEKNWFILESYKDRVLSLHEINESLISYRTNNVVKILTIFSIVILPLTLLSGVYGMNIELPLAEHPYWIWGMFIALFSVITTVILILKKKDWI